MYFKYLDFIGESISALAVVDMALVVLNAANGVEVGTEIMWSNADEQGIPKMIVVNGFDREHTNFDSILAEDRERFGNNVFPMQIPVNSGPGYNKNIDVLRNELITYETNSSGQMSETDLPNDLKKKVESLHQELIEYVAESDDSLLEK